MKLSFGAVASVIALTLGASSAYAEEAPAAPSSAPQVAPAAPQSPPAMTAATPLAPRPSHPLQTAPAPESTPWGYKLLAGLGVAAAAGLWLHGRRRAKPALAKKRSSIDVLARTSVGVRSDLLVVDVDGMRLLVGLTPASIQTLAVLETPPEAEGADEARAAADGKVDEFDKMDEFVKVGPAVVDIGDRVRSLLGPKATARMTAPLDDAMDDDAPAPTPARPRRAQTPKASAASSKPTGKRPRIGGVAGQAKGLLLAMEEATESPVLAKEAASKRRSDPPIRLGDW